jgi:hypothetical protein
MLGAKIKIPHEIPWSNSFGLAIKKVDFQHLEDKLMGKSQQLGMENSLT